MTETQINALIRSTQVLAVLHYGSDPATTGILIEPSLSLSHEMKMELDTQDPMFTPGAHAGYSARIRLGNGKWGSSVGPGREPLEALVALHRGLINAHQHETRRREHYYKVALNTHPTHDELYPPPEQLALDVQPSTPESSPHPTAVPPEAQG